MKRQAKPVADVGDVQSACHILVGKALGHRQVGRLCVNRRDNIKMCHELVGVHDGVCGPGSSVTIATDYGLDGPGIESRWGRGFPPVQTGRGAHPASCKMGTGSFSGVKSGRGVLLTAHPLPAPGSWKSRAIPLPNLWATTGPVTGTLYIYLFI